MSHHHHHHLPSTSSSTTSSSVPSSNPIKSSKILSINLPHIQTNIDIDVHDTHTVRDIQELTKQLLNSSTYPLIFGLPSGATSSNVPLGELKLKAPHRLIALRTDTSNSLHFLSDPALSPRYAQLLLQQYHQLNKTIISHYPYPHIHSSTTTSTVSLTTGSSTHPPLIILQQTPQHTVGQAYRTYSVLQNSIDPRYHYILREMDEDPVDASNVTAYTERINLRIKHYNGAIILKPLDPSKKLNIILDIDHTLMDTEVYNKAAATAGTTSASTPASAAIFTATAAAIARNNTNNGNVSHSSGSLSIHTPAVSSSFSSSTSVLPPYSPHLPPPTTLQLSQYSRPGLQELLVQINQKCNILVWSATGNAHVIAKLRDLGVLDYISVVIDYGAMVRVRAMITSKDKRRHGGSSNNGLHHPSSSHSHHHPHATHNMQFGSTHHQNVHVQQPNSQSQKIELVMKEFNTKPLTVLYGIFPQILNENNTLIVDDHLRSFVMNPMNGIHVRSFHAVGTNSEGIPTTLLNGGIKANSMTMNNATGDADGADDDLNDEDNQDPTAEFSKLAVYINTLANICPPNSVRVMDHNKWREVATAFSNGTGSNYDNPNNTGSSNTSSSVAGITTGINPSPYTSLGKAVRPGFTLVTPTVDRDNITMDTGEITVKKNTTTTTTNSTTMMMDVDNSNSTAARYNDQYILHVQQQQKELFAMNQSVQTLGSLGTITTTASSSSSSSTYPTVGNTINGSGVSLLHPTGSTMPSNTLLNHDTNSYGYPTTNNNGTSRLSSILHPSHNNTSSHGGTTTTVSKVHLPNRTSSASHLSSSSSTSASLHGPTGTGMNRTSSATLIRTPSQTSPASPGGLIRTNSLSTFTSSSGTTSASSLVQAARLATSASAVTNNPNHSSSYNSSLNHILPSSSSTVPTSPYLSNAQRYLQNSNGSGGGGNTGKK